MRNALDRVTLRDLQYLDALHHPLEGAFAEIERQGAAESIPIVGTAVGRALYVLVRATGARRIVEVGTAIGYSALWMASALPADGEVVAIDPDRSRTDRAKAFWRDAGVARRIRVVNGKGLDVLPSLRGPFDLAFIDALKEEYEGYLAHVLRLLRPGGTVAVDNLLWSGRASGSVPDDGPATKAIRAFNERFTRHPLLDATILPVGDGLGVGVRREARFGRSVLRRLEAADEVEIETRSARGAVHRTVVWVASAAGDLYVRSVRGEKGRWYRELVATGEGALHLGRTRIPVRACPVADERSVADASEGLRRKYRRGAPLAAMLRDEVLPTTVRLEPLERAR